MTSYSLVGQHKIPDVIVSEVHTALSFYPQLEKTPISFIFKRKIKKSTMLAQPDFKSVLSPKEKRKYRILISENINIAGQEFKTVDIPKDVLIGWIGHELGHIMDYQNRSTLNLLWFGIRYAFSESYLKEAERAADTYAVMNGMDEYILETKHFILDNADIDETYKDRIRRYYLSPEEIIVLVNERDLKKE